MAGISGCSKQDQKEFSRQRNRKSYNPMAGWSMPLNRRLMVAILRTREGMA